MLILLAYNDTKIVIFGISFFRDEIVDFYNINIFILELLLLKEE